jgi:hypothetical protein
MVIRKECKICKGTGKVTNQHGSFDCPECEYRFLLDNANNLKPWVIYPVPEEKKPNVLKMAQWFGEFSNNRNWRIDLLNNNRIIKVDRF